MARAWGRWRNCLCVIVFTAVALLAVAIAVLLLRHRDAPLCESHLCLHYASLLESTLSKVAQPCDDFHRYVCEGWERTNQMSVKEKMLDQFLEKVLEKATKSTPPKENQTAVQKAAAFYNSCKSAYRGEANEFETVKEDLVRYGVFWPEIRNSSSLLHILFKLSAVWNWGTIVEVSMMRSGHFIIRPTRFYRDTLQRRQAMLRNVQTSGRNFYREYFDAMVGEFRPSNSSGELLSYEKLIALEDEVLKDILGPFSTSNFTTIGNKSLDEMLNITGIVTSKPVWESNILQHFNFTPGHPYVFTIINVEFFVAFFNLVATVGEPKMAYYIGWAIVQPVSLLSKASLNRYYYISDAEAQRGQLPFCHGLAHVYMGLSLYADYMRSKISPVEIQDASVLVHTLRKWLAQTLENSSLPWSQLAAALHGPNGTEEAETATFRLFADAAEEPLDTRYALFPDMGSSVFSNMELATRGRRLTSEDTQMQGFRIHHDARVYYLSGYGFELLPLAFEMPLYQKGAPYAMNYGALGGEIADAFAAVLIRAANTLDNNSRAEMNLKASCLSKRGRPNKTSEGALQLALKALSLRTLYRQFLAVNNVTFRLRPGGQKLLTEEQVFFVIGCYTQCGSPNAMARCNDALKSFSDFGRVFGCARNNAMFSDRDCALT